MGRFWKQLLGLDAGATLTPPEYFSLMPPLETPRLLLRQVKRRDAADYHAYASDPEVARYVLWQAHRSLRETRQVISAIRQRYRYGLPGCYAIILRETGRMIGTIGFEAWHPEQRCMEVGYSLARACWGQGYASEALQALLRQCFDVMQVHRVEAVYDVENPASGSVLAHCGFHPEGVMRRRVLNKGEWRDVCLCAVLAEDAPSAPADGLHPAAESVLPGH